MPNWKQDPLTTNLHTLHIPNGPVLELREYNSGYRYQMMYNWHNSTKLTIQDEQTYTADNLNKAKEHAEMLAKTTFEKVKNNILVALNHIDFFTTEPPQETPTTTNILWTNKITKKEIHDRRAKELLSTQPRTDNEIARKLKQETDKELNDLRHKLDAYMLSDYVLVEITEQQNAHDKSNMVLQTIPRPTLAEILNDPTIDALNYKHTYYFKNNDLYLKTENMFGTFRSIFRLIRRQFFSNNTLIMLKNTTIDELANMDLITIRLEPVIKNALMGLDHIL